MSRFGSRGGRRNFSRSRGSRRRGFEWEVAYPITPQLLVGPSGIFSTTIVANAFIQDMTQPTLVRTRGEIAVEYAYQLGNVPGRGGTLGIGITTQPEVVVTDYELPLSEGDSNHWLYHQVVPLFVPTYPESRPVTAAARIVVDSKAMRKLSDTDEVQLVYQWETFGGASDVVYVMGAFRTLFKDA